MSKNGGVRSEKNLGQRCRPPLRSNAPTFKHAVEAGVNHKGASVNYVTRLMDGGRGGGQGFVLRVTEPC